MSLRKLGSSLASLVGGIAVLVAVCLLAGVFLVGAVWVVSKLQPIAEMLAGIGTLLLLPLLLISAVSRKCRRFCGNGVVIVTFLWGAALWMWATLILYQLWGGFGLFLGVILLGVGSVPLACVALLLQGKFAVVAGTIVAVIFIFAVRRLGVWVAARGEPGDGSVIQDS